MVLRELCDGLREQVRELAAGESWVAREQLVARIDELEDAYRAELNDAYRQGVADEREQRLLTSHNDG